MIQIHHDMKRLLICNSNQGMVFGSLLMLFCLTGCFCGLNPMMDIQPGRRTEGHTARGYKHKSTQATIAHIYWFPLCYKHSRAFFSSSQNKLTHPSTLLVTDTPIHTQWLKKQRGLHLSPLKDSSLCLISACITNGAPTTFSYRAGSNTRTYYGH